MPSGHIKSCKNMCSALPVWCDVGDARIPKFLLSCGGIFNTDSNFVCNKTENYENRMTISFRSRNSDDVTIWLQGDYKNDALREYGIWLQYVCCLLCVSDFKLGRNQRALCDENGCHCSAIHNTIQQGKHYFKDVPQKYLSHRRFSSFTC